MATNRRRLFGLVAGAVGVLGLASYGVVQWQERAGRAADGGARLTVAAARPDGTAPSSKEFDRTKDLLMTRLKAAQLKQPHVDISADNRLVLRAGGEATGEMLRGLAASGRAQIRKVAAAVKLDGATSTGSPLPAVPETTVPAQRQAVAAKLGDAYRAAQALRRPEDGSALPPSTLDAFAGLSPAEVAALPPLVQLLVPSIDCAKLRGSYAEAGTGQTVVLCDQTTKYLLDPAALTGQDIAGAKSGLVTETGGWMVTMSFTAQGQARFSALTRELAPSAGQVAILMDTAVISAPQILGEITGDAQITGKFTRTDVEVLAAQLTSGELPLRLTPVG